MNYIVFDLEWNQSNTGKDEEVKTVPFEIIEIGALKLNDNFEITGEFNRLIKPQIYHEMHHITRKLIHLQIEELENESFLLMSYMIFLHGAERIICFVLGGLWI